MRGQSSCITRAIQKFSETAKKMFGTVELWSIVEGRVVRAVKEVQKVVMLHR